jgi:hypothetical protein
VRDLEEFLSKTMDRPMPRLLRKSQSASCYNQLPQQAAKVQPC